MSSMLNFFGLPFVDGSSKAIFDRRSICKSFSFMTLDNLCGISNLSLKSKIHFKKPSKDLSFNSIYSEIFATLL